MKTHRYEIARQARAIARDFYPKLKRYIRPHRELRKGRAVVLENNHSWPCSRCSGVPQTLLVLWYRKRIKGRAGGRVWETDSHQRCIGPDAGACEFRMAVRT